MNLPVEFKEKMKKFLGDEWEDFLYCYENNKYQALRFNVLKEGLDRSKYEAVLNRLGIREVTPVDWAVNGYYYDEATARPGKHPYHEIGLYYIQEPSAMSAASLLEPKPEMRVLDLCAAPGGKSTQLASYLGQKGLLVSNEINNSRCRILSSNIERMGVRNAVVTNEDSGSLAEHFPGFFHAVLVDAPCSGEGMFRKNPEAMNEWSPEQVLVCAKRQYEIICNASAMLMPGGDMVYSTCTFSQEENEDLIERFLSEHQEYTLVEQKRIMPHKVHGEGHFVAKLHREGVLNFDEAEANCICASNTDSAKKSGKDKKSEKDKKSGKDKSSKAKASKGSLSTDMEKALDEFLSDTVSEEMAQWIKAGRLELFGEQLYRLPDVDINLRGIHVLRAGLHIGEFKKNRFEPSFALALTLGKSDVKKYVEIPCEDMRTLGYFNGQSIIFDGNEIDPKLKGWCLFGIDGFSAGWGKIANGQMKNHYPKGLRRNLA